MAVVQVPIYTTAATTTTSNAELSHLIEDLTLTCSSHQMDFGINSVIQSLLGNDDGQYCKSLFGLGERAQNYHVNNIEDIDSNPNESDSDNSVSKECCQLCSKTYQSPNNLAVDEIRRCKSLLKVSGRGHFLRDNSITSLNLDDYLRPSIWCWHPQRLLPSTSKPLVCWNNNCAGHLGKLK
jgi:hypothetical protein